MVRLNEIRFATQFELDLLLDSDKPKYARSAVDVRSWCVLRAMRVVWRLYSGTSTILLLHAQNISSVTLI